MVARLVGFAREVRDGFVLNGDSVISLVFQHDDG